MEKMDDNLNSSTDSLEKDNFDVADSDCNDKHRRIKSYVLREGRMTTGQEKALQDLFPVMGIEYQKSLIDPDAIFGRHAPLTVEIGFGMGKSFVEMATADSKRNFIGIEVHTAGVGACLMAAKENELTNLRVIHHDAVDVLKDMFPENSIDRLQLFFPDPWHKARHHKRRLVQPEFLDLVIPHIKKDGIIHMATDWEEYAMQMLEVQSADDRLENIAEDKRFIPRPDFRPLTKFELRGEKLGHGVWDLMFRKK